MNDSYYLAYEARYRAVHAAGIERWGHSPLDGELARALGDFVDTNNLMGKRVVDFACGEGACGEILAPLGCQYLGVDISPAAIEKAAQNLKNYPNARVKILDMVNQIAGEDFDAAVDCMGFHMLVLDPDREKYLANAISALRPGAAMIFFRQMSDTNAPQARVETMEQWLALTGSDYRTLHTYNSGHSGDNKQLMLPRVPGRARSKQDFARELTNAGFAVEAIIDMPENTMCPHSVTIYARKPL